MGQWLVQIQLHLAQLLRLTAYGQRQYISFLIFSISFFLYFWLLGRENPKSEKPASGVMNRTKYFPHTTQTF